VKDTELEDRLLAEIEAAEAGERRRAEEAKREKLMRQQKPGLAQGQKGLPQKGQSSAAGGAGLTSRDVPGSSQGAGSKRAGGGAAGRVVGGVEVHVSGLPKKRNIERDLRAALRAHKGLLGVTPALQGSAKTRDPVCTGLATLSFSDLKSAQL